METEEVSSTVSSEEAPESVYDQAVTQAAKEDDHVDSNFWEPDDEEERTVIGKRPNGQTMCVVRRKEGGYRITTEKLEGNFDPRYQGWFTSYGKAEAHCRDILNQERDEHAKRATA